MSYLDDLFARYGITMSVPEVAEVLGRPRPTIYKWLNDGTIPGSKVMGSWTIYTKEVKALVASGRNLPEAEEASEAEEAAEEEPQ